MKILKEFKRTNNFGHAVAYGMEVQHNNGAVQEYVFPDAWDFEAFKALVGFTRPEPGLSMDELTRMCTTTDIRNILERRDRS